MFISIMDVLSFSGRPYVFPDHHITVMQLVYMMSESMMFPFLQKKVPTTCKNGTDGPLVCLCQLNSCREL